MLKIITPSIDGKLCTEVHKYWIGKEIPINGIFHHIEMTQNVSICVSKLIIFIFQLFWHECLFFPALLLSIFTTHIFFNFTIYMITDILEQNFIA